jgi:hypothetical protein
MVSCPKPGCPWTVDPATVPAGGVVTCPKCGQRFRLAAAAPAARGGGFGSAVLAVGGVLVAVAVLAGVVVAAVLLKRNLGGDRQTPATADVRDEDRNFAYTPPGGDWRPDADTRNALGVNVLGLHRPTAPEHWAGLAVKDYGKRVPLASELRDAMAAALGRVFLNLPAEPQLEAATWAGQPALVWKFRGEHRTTGRVCAGEAVTLTAKGVGYWLYGWAAEREFDPTELARVRDGFRLLDGRAGWAATAASEVAFPGPAGDYKLVGYERIWEPVPPSAGGGKTPDLELRGVLKNRGRRDFPPRAEVRVWKVADPGDPSAVAEKLVKAENTRDPEAFGPTAFAEVPGEPAGDPPPGPDAPPASPVRRLKVTTGSTDTGRTARLVAYAAARVGDAVVVAEGSCPWDEREVWERRLVQLVGSVR